METETTWDFFSSLKIATLFDKEAQTANIVLPIWWHTEVIELFVRYWAVVPADGNRPSIFISPQHFVLLSGLCFGRTVFKSNHIGNTFSLQKTLPSNNVTMNRNTNDKRSAVHLAFGFALTHKPTLCKTKRVKFSQLIDVCQE